VVARQQHTADSGDIVVALIENEATVKRLRRRGKVWQLEAENPAYAPIPITEPLTVQGKVIAVYRHLA
jgi:repressor LexA